MDEATSALDDTSESSIVQTVKALKEECLIIFVSHRPGILEIADYVIDFDKDVGSVLSVA
jgi:ABC-type bacteriocin/lantibiotic exporter with double-glycine peptidase domain